MAILTSCAQASNDWSELTSSEAGAADSLPASVEQSEGVEDIDPASVRFQWEAEGVAYYSALSASAADSGCLIVVEDETAQSACGRLPPLIYDGEHGKFALGSHAPESEGWEELTSVLWRES
jgi:hypothetical protein